MKHPALHPIARILVFLLAAMPAVMPAAPAQSKPDAKQGKTRPDAVETLAQVLAKARQIEEIEDDSPEKTIALFSRHAATERDPLAAAAYHGLTAQALWEYCQRKPFPQDAPGFGPAPAILPVENPERNRTEEPGKKGKRRNRIRQTESRTASGPESWSRDEFLETILFHLEKSSNSMPAGTPEQQRRYDSAALVPAPFQTSYKPCLPLVLRYQAWDLLCRMQTFFPEARLEEKAETVFAGIRDFILQFPDPDSALALADMEIRHLRQERLQGKIGPQAYEKALLDLRSKYPGNIANGDILYLLAFPKQDTAPLQAEALARQALAYPGSWGCTQSKILLDNLLSASLTVELPQVQIPGKAIPATVREKNCAAFGYRFLKLDEPGARACMEASNLEKFLQELFKAGTGTVPIHSCPLPFNEEDLLHHRGKIFFPPLEKGFYAIETRILERRYPEKAPVPTDTYPPDYQIIQVSDLAYFCYPEKRNRSRWEGFCMNREDGKPLPGARVDVFQNHYQYEHGTNRLQRIATSFTGKDGRFAMDSSLVEEGIWHAPLLLRLTLGQDTLWSQKGIALSHPSPARDRHPVEQAGNPWEGIQSVCYFNNLPVYRKGDSVKLFLLLVPHLENSAFATGESGFLAHPKEIQVSIEDPDSRIWKIFTLPVEPNGIARLAFQIPADAKAGFWQASTPGFPSSCTLEVENYKRPSFEISWEEIPLRPRQGVFTLKGRARYLNGQAVKAGSARFRVYRNASPSLLRYPGSFPGQGGNRALVAENQIPVSEEGVFEIRFRQDSTLDDASLQKACSACYYEIEGELSDAGGETQAFQARIPLKTAYALECENPELIVGNGQAWFNAPGYLLFSMSGLEPGQTWQQTCPEAEAYLLSDTLETSPFASPLHQIAQDFGSGALPQKETCYVSSSRFKQLLPYEPYFDEISRTGSLVREKIELSSRQTRLLRDSGKLVLPADWAPGIYEIRLAARTPDGQILSRTERVCIAQTGRELPRGMNSAAFLLCPQAVQMHEGKTTVGLAIGNPLPFPLQGRIRIEDAQGNCFQTEKRIEPGLRLHALEPIALDTASDWAASLFFQAGGRAILRSSEIILPKQCKRLNWDICRLETQVLPGVKDTLCFRIPFPGTGMGEPQALIAAMYDQSLDFFSANGSPWPSGANLSDADARLAPSLLLPPFRRAYLTGWDLAPIPDNETHLYLYPAGIEHPAAAYPPFPARLDWDGFPALQFHARMNALALRSGMKTALVKGEAAPSLDAPLLGKAIPETDARADGNAGTLPGSDAQIAALRSDFRPEVLFRLVEWEKDGAGFRACLPLEYPQYFGRLKLQAFAYTNRFHAGRIEKEILVNQALMLYPQTPRFVRKGDSVLLACRYLIKDSCWKSGKNSSLEWEITAEARASSSSAWEKAAVLHRDTLLQNAQGAIELPLKTSPEWSQLRISFQARATIGNGQQRLHDRIVVDIPIEENRSRLHQYQTFCVRKGEEAGIRTGFDLPCDSLSLRFNASAEPLLREILSEKAADSCKTAIMAADKLSAAYFSGKDWESLWPVLLSFRKEDGGFGWLRESPASFETGLLVLESLAAIPQKDLQKLDGWHETAARTLQELALRMEEDYRRDTCQENESGQAQAPAMEKLRFLHLCAVWPQLSQGGSIRAMKTYYLGQASLFYRELSLEGQALLLSCLLSENLHSQALAVLENLNRRALYDARQGMYWKREALGSTPGRRMQSMAALAKAYGKAALSPIKTGKGQDSLREQCREILNWFPSQQQSLDFSNPAGGIGTRQLVAWASALLLSESLQDSSREEPGNWVFELGKNRLETRQENFEENFSGNELETFRNRLRVKWEKQEGCSRKQAGKDAEKARKSLFFASSACGFGSLRAASTREMASIQAHEGDGSLVIRQHYRKTGGKGFRQGDMVESVMEIKARRDFHYVRVSSPRPAGLEWASTQSGWDYESGFPCYKDVDDSFVDYFFEFLPKGTYFLSFRLKAQNRGVFSHGPSQVESQNESGFGSHSQGGFIRIE